MKEAKDTRRAFPLTAVVAALLRPRLWPALLALVPPRWWRRWPPLPIPPRDYLDFRIQTMYGDGGGSFRPADLIDYLEWCRRMTPRSR